MRACVERRRSHGPGLRQLRLRLHWLFEFVRSGRRLYFTTIFYYYTLLHKATLCRTVIYCDVREAELHWLLKFVAIRVREEQQEASTLVLYCTILYYTALYAYVYTYIHIYVYICTCICATYVCKLRDICISVYAYAYMQSIKHVHIYIYTQYMHICIHIYTDIHISRNLHTYVAYMHVHIYTYKCIYVYTHVYTYIHTSLNIAYIRCRCCDGSRRLVRRRHVRGVLCIIYIE